MQDSVKNYWKLGKDQFGDTLWMQKPRLCPNGYWEVALVFHYPKGCRPGKGDSRFCAIIANELMSASSAMFEGLMPEEIRYKFLELMRAIVISSRYYCMLKRGNTGMTEVDGEAKVLRRYVSRPPMYGLSEIQRINLFVIPGLISLVDELFK
jgi:hypothetical protein